MFCWTNYLLVINITDIILQYHNYLKNKLLFISSSRTSLKYVIESQRIWDTAIHIGKHFSETQLSCFYSKYMT